MKHLLPASAIFGLILAAGFISYSATGSPAILLSVSGGVFLITLFANNFSVALPLASSAGLVTFSLAIREFVPWSGVALALLLVAWSGCAHLRRPPPAALASGFFGAVVLAFDLWRGPLGQRLDPALIPYLAASSAASGFALLVPDGRRPEQALVSPVRHRTSIPLLHFASTAAAAAAAIALTAALANPMGTFAAHLREASGGPPTSAISDPEPSDQTANSPSSDLGRPLPRRADVNLSHDFELLVRLDSAEAASRLASSQVYCRTMVFDRYEADRWLPPDTNEWFEDLHDGSRDSSVQVAPVPNRLAPESLVRHTVFVPASPNLVLPSLQGVVRFEIPRVIKIGSSTFGHPSRLERHLSYRAESAVRTIGHFPLNAILPARSASPHDLQLPQGATGTLIRNLAAKITPPDGSLPATIAAIQSFFRDNTSYSTLIENPNDLPPLENFLLGERRGYCEFYATAGTLLLRAAGFPARTAFGFSGGERTSDPREFAFFSDDGHAWTEVHLDNIGWCVVEFTPPGHGATAPPSPPAPGSPAFGQDSFASLREIDLEAYGSWADSGNLAGPDWPHLGSFIAAAVALLLAALAAAFIRQNPQTASPAHRTGTSLPPLAPEPGFYRSFCDAAARAGFPKHPGQTPKEHLALIASKAPIHAAKSADLVDYYYAVRYENAPADARRERSFRSSSSSFTRS